MDAKVDVHIEYGVITPSGDSAAYSYGELVNLSSVRLEDKNAKAWTDSRRDNAQEWVNKMNRRLRDMGIDDQSYRVVKRTITVVTSEWELS